jgi:ectoine hydroxylase-related dioxygenase (phytanoyl-CoA dioxygenase family)
MGIDVATAGVLTAEQQESFDRDGYVVLDGICAPELVDRVVGESESLYRDAFDPGPEVADDGIVFTRHEGGTEKYHWHRVRNAWKIRLGIREMALAPKAMAAAEVLFGRKPLPFQTLNFPMGTEQPPHIDAFYFHSEPAGYMCGVWVALEDMDMDNGPLVYYPGSHKLPLPDWDEIARVTGVRVSRDDFTDATDYRVAGNGVFSQYCQKLIEVHGLEPRYGTIRKGQVLIWAPNLLHGGAPQRDRARTRHSQVTHYFFEGCRHYVPLHSEGDHVFWDYLEWIREPPPGDTMEELSDFVRSYVPPAATLLVSSGYESVLELGDRRPMPFPQDADGGQVAPGDVSGETAVELLERLRGEGAEYAVFPKPVLGWLEHNVPELQAHLENRYRAVVRDGAYCAIYSLS